MTGEAKLAISSSDLRFSGECSVQGGEYLWPISKKEKQKRAYETIRKIEEILSSTSLRKGSLTFAETFQLYHEATLESQIKKLVDNTFLKPPPNSSFFVPTTEGVTFTTLSSGRTSASGKEWVLEKTLKFREFMFSPFEQISVFPSEMSEPNSFARNAEETVSFIRRAYANFCDKQILVGQGDKEAFGLFTMDEEEGIGPDRDYIPDGANASNPLSIEVLRGVVAEAGLAGTLSAIMHPAVYNAIVGGPGKGAEVLATQNLISGGEFLMPGANLVLSEHAPANPQAGEVAVVIGNLSEYRWMEYPSLFLEAHKGCPIILGTERGCTMIMKFNADGMPLNTKKFARLVMPDNYRGVLGGGFITRSTKLCEQSSHSSLDRR